MEKWRGVVQLFMCIPVHCSEKCIKGAVESNNLCPLCRTSLTSIFPNHFGKLIVVV